MIEAPISTDPAIRQERALIGGLLQDRDAIAAIAEWLRPGAFADPTCRLLYEAILACWHDRVPPDAVTIDHGLRKVGPAAQKIPVTDLIDMMLECPFSVHVEYYARNVASYAKRRVIADLGATMAAGSQVGDDFDYDAAYREAVEQIEMVAPADEQAGLVPYADLVPDFQDRIVRQLAGDEIPTETSTGFRDLDHRLRGGFRPGELILLGARPGMGKTACALQLAHNAARTGKHVLFFSSEMSAESLLWRAAGEISGVSPRAIEDGKPPAQIADRYLFATERMVNMTVAIDDTSGVSTDQLLVRTQRYQRRHDLGLVVFDYLELAGDRVKGDSEEQRVSAIARRLKHVARVCDVPVLVLSQLSREVERRAGAVPKLSDLRYSGALEAHADVVLFLYRRAYYVEQRVLEPDEAKDGIAEVIVAKHRNGPTGTVELRFEPETMKFYEIDWRT